MFMIYLDYTANCPTDKDVLDTYINTTNNYYANPNSFHDLGLQANELLNKNSLEILQLLHKEDADIIYTSGASESNNLVIKGIAERYKSRGKHIIIGSFEHNSITVPISKLQQLGYEVDIVPVDKDGIVDLEELEYLLRDDTILVSICSVDSELGIRQPIEKIGEMLKDHSCFFHSDASQAIGKTEIDFSDVDLITMTPHKFYGINGSGALIKNKNVGLVPIIDGGKSTTEFRSGTPVLANVTAMKKALELVTMNYEKRYNIVKEYHDYLINFFTQYPDIHINNTKYSVPHIINISIPSIPSMTFADKLNQKQIYISTKNSCCPTATPSKLVYALTHSKQLASSSLRISLSHLTTNEELKVFTQTFDHIYKELKNGKI